MQHTAAPPKKTPSPKIQRLNPSTQPKPLQPRTILKRSTIPQTTEHHAQKLRSYRHDVAQADRTVRRLLGVQAHVEICAGLKGREGRVECRTSSALGKDCIRNRTRRLSIHTQKKTASSTHSREYALALARGSHFHLRHLGANGSNFFSHGEKRFWFCFGCWLCARGVKKRGSKFFNCFSDSMI
jgi:hypothetical protein